MRRGSTALVPLKSRRVGMALTAEEMARCYGVDEATYLEWEAAGSAPAGRTLDVAMAGRLMPRAAEARARQRAWRKAGSI